MTEMPWQRGKKLGFYSSNEHEPPTTMQGSTLCTRVFDRMTRHTTTKTIETVARFLHKDQLVTIRSNVVCVCVSKQVLMYSRWSRRGKGWSRGLSTSFQTGRVMIPRDIHFSLACPVHVLSSPPSWSDLSLLFFFLEVTTYDDERTHPCISALVASKHPVQVCVVAEWICGLHQDLPLKKTNRWD